MTASVRLILVVALLVVGFFVPRVLGGSPAIYSACVLISIFAAMAYGLDTIVSDVGEVSLGQSVFFAAGAYTTALLSTGPRLGPFPTLLGSIAIALLIAAVLGFVTLALREFVFSLVTYAVVVVAASLAQNWSFLGGSDGLRGIPAFELSFGSLSFTARNDQELWPVAYLLVLVAIYLVYAFRHSRLGQSALMTHLNPQLANMSGVRSAKHAPAGVSVLRAHYGCSRLAVRIPTCLRERGRARNLLSYSHAHRSCSRRSTAAGGAAGRGLPDPCPGEVPVVWG